ncbi:MAG: hypothetical protein SPJ27_07470, partial [Candidatus Onthovivens sp.]|nr:hypothetical protein [Candidatus Onthovivens sp.]
YTAKVKWNGDHYYAGDEVKGSKLEKRADGTTWLFDDEPIPEFPFYGEGRDEWVEVDESTVVKNIYSNGYSLEDKPGHSFVRGTFKSVKKAKIYAEENNLPWWRIVAYNDETNTFDVIEEKK